MESGHASHCGDVKGFRSEAAISYWFCTLGCQRRRFSSVSSKCFFLYENISETESR
jgi:hypothetical protein